MGVFVKRNIACYGKAPEVSPERRRELLLFQSLAGIKFRDLTLLNLAFSHSSYANEFHNQKVDSNELLEFLGDSVLSLAVSTWLFTNLNDGSKDEGDFSRIRSFVVSEDSLADIGADLRISDFLLMGHGEELSGGRQKKAIIADCMEAIFGAYYLDQGFRPAIEFIESLLVPHIQDVLANRQRKDYKSLLQEYSQKRYKKYPTYRLVKVVGPEHDNIFYMEVEVQNRVYGPASGKNKKEAEQNAAEIAFKALSKEP